MESQPKPTLLSSLLPDSTRMLIAGGSAGAIARTCTAPLDRMKLLFQVQGIASSGAASGAYRGLAQTAGKIVREEGVLAFWRGNGVNIIRIFPYSSVQLASNDFYKRLLADEHNELSLPRRLMSGACAGMTATAATHPLDTVRLRLALPNHTHKGAVDAAVTIVRSEGVMALYKGVVPALIGIAPYAALNFATYDLLKKWLYHGERPQSTVANLMVGGMSGITAASICYPLDTIRRRMQLKGHVYNGQLDAVATIFRVEGVRGFYRGWVANSVKVIPQNALRMVAYEAMKGLLGVKKRKTDT